jgi:hypothetical protein
MLKDMAARWAEHHLSAIPFPFPTLAEFKAEFHLQFVEENEQDQALTKLESHSYFQGSHDIYWYTDDFEELAVTAGYSDTLVRVTKYRSGLGPWINIAITTGTALNLTDYNGWHARAFWQYEVFGRAWTGNPPARIGNLPVQLPAALPRLCTVNIFPAPAPPCALVLFTPLPAPGLLAVVLMDVDQTRTCVFPRTCFQCGATRHLMCECPIMSDVWHTDVLDKVVCQLGDDLLDELFTCLATIALLPKELINEDADPAGFPSLAE